MESLAGIAAREWHGLTLQTRAPRREPIPNSVTMPILDGLRALACELAERGVLGAGTETALTLLESARQLVRHACGREDEAGNVMALAPADMALAQGGLAGWQIRALTGYIDGHLEAKLCLDGLAEVVRLSPSYLCRACRQSLDCSPMQYVMQRRLRAARRLLRQSAMPLSELALTCGFADQAHFTRSFRAATGETPLRWRRMWQIGIAPLVAGDDADGTPAMASAGVLLAAGATRQIAAHPA